MKKAGSKIGRKKRRDKRHKYCPECKEEMAMSVTHEAESDRDLYWLFCPSCESRFALTRQQYQKGKHPDISAIKPDGAKTYHSNQTYKVGQLIYHSKLGDVGVIVDKAAAPGDVECSGSIIVSFTRIGQKRLIEGYAAG